MLEDTIRVCLSWLVELADGGGDSSLFFSSYIGAHCYSTRSSSFCCLLFVALFTADYCCRLMLKF